MNPSPVPSPKTFRSTAAGVLGGLVLLTVLTGVPVTLWTLIGPPWPEASTSLNDLAGRLAQPIGDPLALQLLALIGWACWVLFAATVVREAAWYLARMPHLRRDRTLHAVHLDTLPGPRFLVAACIGTLVFTLLAWLRPLPAAAHPAPTAPPASAAVASTTSPAQTATGPHSERGSPQETPVPFVPYTVLPGDTLWDIAKHRLGDGVRWPEIYGLSRTIAQPDGARLADPDHLLPGWRLHLPADAHHPTPPHPHPKPGPEQTNPEAESEAAAPDLGIPHPGPIDPGARGLVEPSESGHAADDRANQAPAPSGSHIPDAKVERAARGSTAQDTASSPRPVQVSVGAASVIGVTTAAGIAAAVALVRARARRRRTPDLTTSPPSLSSAVRAANRATLAARHADSAEHAAEPDIMRRPAPANPAPPGTVTVAQREGVEVTVEALASKSGWNLTGPGARPAARALAIAALSAARRLAPRPPRVRLIVPAALAEELLPSLDPALPGWTQAADAADAVRLARVAALDRARIHHDADLDQDPPSGAVSTLPMDVLLLDAPASPEAAALAQQAAPGELAVVALNADLLASTAVLAVDGTVEHITGPHATALDGAGFFTLAPGPAGELLAALTATVQPDPPGENADERGGEAPVVPPPPAGPPAPPSPPAHEPGTIASPALNVQATPTHEEPGDNGPGTSGPRVTIRLFGGLSLNTDRGEVPLSMKGTSKEFLAILAAHPDGIRSDAVVDSLRLSSDRNRATKDLVNLRRALRRTVRQVTGAPSAAVVLHTGDRHRLDPQLVTSDVAAFTTALSRATHTADADERARALGDALEEYRGRMCEGADYPWADELREYFHHRAVDAAVYLADHALSADPEQALALLERAADWEPTSEPVCQRLMHVHHQLGHLQAAQHAYHRLERHLAEIDATPTETTRALRTQSTPDTSSDLRKRGSRQRRGSLAHR